MNNKPPIEKNVFYGIFFIVILSSLLHFLYDISNDFFLFAFISPINESVWEHLKLPLLPTILWWIISYYVLIKNNNVNMKKWLFSGAVSLLVSILVIILLHYTYTGALGIESPLIDILILVVSIIAGQTIALKIYTCNNLKPQHYYIGFTMFFLLLILIIIFTFKAPHLPIFRDPKTGQYGLY